MTLPRLLCGVLLLAGCKLHCPLRTKVLAVGGCDDNGRCGVLTEHGPDRTYYPVVGQTVTVYRPCKAQE